MKVNPYNLLNEANIKFKIAYDIKAAGMNVALEYRVNWSSGRADVFDIVVIKNEYIVGIIECKRAKRQKTNKSGQIKRYERYGIPVFLADGPQKIELALEFAREQTAKEISPQEDDCAYHYVQRKEVKHNWTPEECLRSAAKTQKKILESH